MFYPFCIVLRLNYFLKLIVGFLVKQYSVNKKQVVQIIGVNKKFHGKLVISWQIVAVNERIKMKK